MTALVSSTMMDQQWAVSLCLAGLPTPQPLPPLRQSRLIHLMVPMSVRIPSSRRSRPRMAAILPTLPSLSPSPARSPHLPSLQILPTSLTHYSRHPSRRILRVWSMSRHQPADTPTPVRSLGLVWKLSLHPRLTSLSMCTRRISPRRVPLRLHPLRPMH